MKIKLLCSFLGILILFGLNSCRNSEKNSTVDYIPVQEDKGDKWGMIGPDGQMLFVNEFEKEPSVVVNGVFYVEENNSYSLYVAEEKPKLIPNAEELKCAGYYSEGLVPIVRKDERITLIDKNGKLVLTLEPINGNEVIECRPIFMDDNLIVKLQNNKYGSINKEGQVIVNPIYDSMGFFSEGVCIGLIKDNDDSDKYTLVGLDTKGKELFKLKDNYKIISTARFRGGRMPVKKGDILGYINKSGEFTKLPAKFEEYLPFNDKYFAFKNSDGNWGVADKENEVILRAKYETLSYLGDNNFFVKNGEDYQIVNSKADLITEIDEKNVLNINNFYNELGFNSNFWFLGGKTNSIMFYNREGKATTKNDFYEIGLNGLFLSTQIESDYFDLSGAITAFADYITDNGITTATLGEPMRKYVSNSNSPSSYTYTYSVSQPTDKFDFHKAYMSIYLRSDNSIAESEARYSYSEDRYYIYRHFDGYDYVWNPNSKLDDIELVLRGPKPIFERGKEILSNILHNKGFTNLTDISSYTALKKGNTYVVISCPSDLDKIEVNILTESRYKKLNFNYLTSNYNSAKGAEIPEEEAPVEEVVADAAVVVDTAAGVDYY